MFLSFICTIFLNKFLIFANYKKDYLAYRIIWSQLTLTEFINTSPSSATRKWIRREHSG